MSSLADRIRQARTARPSVGPRSVLVPRTFLAASLVAVAAAQPATSVHAPTHMVGDDLPPEAHAMTPIDVPPPPPLEALRGAEQELAEIEATLIEPSPLPRAPRYAKKSRSRPTRVRNVQVKQMSEPVLRMKNGNGNANRHHRSGNDVVHVTLRRKRPSLDAPEKAIAWLQGLVGKVHVSAVPTMLDYYRRLGWIPNESYGWIVELATGLTKSAQPATWRMVRNDPTQLAAIHRESYRQLKGLFGERMNRTI